MNAQSAHPIHLPRILALTAAQQNRNPVTHSRLLPSASCARFADPSQHLPHICNVNSGVSQQRLGSGSRGSGSMTVVGALAGGRHSDGVPDTHPDILSVVCSAENVSHAVQRLGRELAAEYADKRPLLLGALTGAFVFTADLARAMLPVPPGLVVDFFAASSYGAAMVSDGDVRLEMGGKIPVTGRHVIVVEDIIDTGKTLQRVVQRLTDAGAASVKVAVLLDKAARRKVAVHPDYCCLKCPDEFVVGYGLDFDEKYRSLPYVGILKPECYQDCL